MNMIMSITTQRDLDNKVDFHAINEDPFWNFGNEPEIGIHKIHVYPAKFPSLIAKQAFEYAKQKNLKVNCVADIFCGCGTVAVEAKRKGIKFWGCDINPIAVLISRAKSTNYNVETIKNLETAIINHFEQNNNIAVNYVNANARLKYWFIENQYNDLAKLKNAIEIETPDDGDNVYRRLFFCIFSSILKGASKWLSKSVKPQVDPHKKPTNVLRLFKRQVSFVIKAIEEVKYPQSFSKVDILEENILDETSREFVDMIITSPPYVTSYEYADLHQLSALWLGYAESYTDLRYNSIGSSHNVGKGKCPEGLTPTAQKIVNYFNWDSRQTRSIARYYADMRKFTQKSYDILNHNGLAVFVIGDTERRGRHIENAKCLCECMIKSGFTIIEVSKRAVQNKLLPSYRDENGKFSSDKKARLIYSQEYIIIGRKV